MSNEQQTATTVPPPPTPADLKNLVPPAQLKKDEKNDPPKPETLPVPTVGPNVEPSHGGP